MSTNLIDKYKKFSPQIKASMWFLIASVLQKGISVITTPIFTRIMTSADYGQYAVFNSWMQIISVIVTLDLSAGVYTMGIVKFKEDEKIYTSSLQGLTATLCLIWGAIYFLKCDFWNKLFNLTTVQMSAMLVMIWTSAAFTFWMTTQRNQFHYKLLIMMSFVVAILNPSLCIFLALNSQDKVTARILGSMLINLACYTPFFFIQMHHGKTYFSFKYWKYAIMFNIPLIPHYLSGTILNSSDRIMIQRLVGESEAGLYSLAYNVAVLMMMVNDALNKTMSPWLYQKIRGKEYGQIHLAVYPSLIFIGICNLILIAVAPELVKIFAPPEYMSAIYVIAPVALSGFFSYLYLCFAPFEFYFEKRVWTTIGTLVSAVSNIILNYIFINVYGYTAAGYTTLACSILNAIMHMYFMNKVCKEYLGGIRPYDIKKLITISILFVFIGLMFIPIYNYPIIRYLIILICLVVALVKRKILIHYISIILGK